MFRKTLIALAATAALAASMSASAQAKTHISVNLGFGGGYGCGYACDPGFGGGYGGVGFYDDGGYGSNCGWQWVNVKKWSNWQHHFVIKHKKVWSCY
jgi:hypothetical protein